MINIYIYKELINMASQEMIDKYVGKVFPSTYDGDMEVLEVMDDHVMCKVKFLESGSVRSTHLICVRKGHVRDKEVRPVYKVGVMDLKGYIGKAKSNPKDYNAWNGMLQRCYNENIREQLKSYEGVEVSEDFKIFSKFKEWYNRQIGSDNKDWHLDKDLLSKGKKKVYSDETCVLLPPEINTLITNNKSVRGDLPVGVIWNCTKTGYRARVQKPTGWESLGTHDTPEQAFNAYKKVKEAYIKEVANKWKDKLDPRAYEALMTWEINIDD